MKTSRFGEYQIIRILKQAEAGAPVTDPCRTYGFNKCSYYRWQARCGGMEVSNLRRLHELDEENRPLEPMRAQQSLENWVLKDVVEKSCDGGPEACAGRLGRRQTRAGKIAFDVPQVGESDFCPQSLEKGPRRERLRSWLWHSHLRKVFRPARWLPSPSSYVAFRSPRPR